MPSSGSNLAQLSQLCRVKSRGHLQIIKNVVCLSCFVLNWRLESIDEEYFTETEENDSSDEFLTNKCDVTSTPKKTNHECEECVNYEQLNSLLTALLCSSTRRWNKSCMVFKTSVFISRFTSSFFCSRHEHSRSLLEG